MWGRWWRSSSAFSDVPVEVLAPEIEFQHFVVGRMHNVGGEERAITFPLTNSCKLQLVTLWQCKQTCQQFCDATLAQCWFGSAVRMQFLFTFRVNLNNNYLFFITSIVYPNKNKPFCIYFLSSLTQVLYKWHSLKSLNQLLLTSVPTCTQIAREIQLWHTKQGNVSLVTEQIAVVVLCCHIQFLQNKKKTNLPSFSSFRHSISNYLHKCFEME